MTTITRNEPSDLMKWGNVLSLDSEFIDTTRGGVDGVLVVIPATCRDGSDLSLIEFAANVGQLRDVLGY